MKPTPLISACFTALSLLSYYAHHVFAKMPVEKIILYHIVIINFSNVFAYYLQLTMASTSMEDWIFSIPNQYA